MHIPTTPDQGLPAMTTRAQEVIAEQNQPAAPPTEEAKTSKKTKELHAEIRQQVELCKTYRRKLARNWSLNIDYRRGKPFASQIDEDAVAVNLDWSFTKTKQASLFSQIPQARVTHHPDSISAPWLPPFERKLNDTIREAGIEAAMEEVLPDCINAAGFGVALVSYETITEDRNVPSIDLSVLPPELQGQLMQSGKLPDGSEVPMETVPVVVDRRYVIQRISPTDFLWPIDFTGSNFDNAAWLGHTGRITWAEAKQRFSLKDEDRASLSTEETQLQDRLTNDADREQGDNDKVGYDEIFVKDYQFNTESRSFKAIRHLVFLHGRTEPVKDEPWKGQDLDEESGEVIGALKVPLRVLTLTYLSDEAIPPSDSAIGRPQVNEINRGRTLNMRQRERSIPVRWHDVNRVDPAIQAALMRGVWQQSLPVQGDGSRIIGEIQRAAMHPENFTFDQISKQDLQEQWTIGPSQTGVGQDVETKGEANVLQANFQTKVGRERARVGSFFTGIAEVLGGFICLYEEPSAFGEGFNPAFSRFLQVSILADSTILIDSSQKLDRLNNFVNTYAKTGFVSLEPVLREIATLIGLDPNVVIKAPEPQPPAEPNVSLRLSGSDDMLNPLTLGFLIKSGQAPTPEIIEQAKQLIQQAVTMPQPPQQPPGGPIPEPPPPEVGEANPQATILPTIKKRSDDPSGEF